MLHLSLQPELPARYPSVIPKLLLRHYLIIYCSALVHILIVSSTHSTAVVNRRVSHSSASQVTSDLRSTEAKDLYHSMLSILSSYRNTEPTNSTSTNRYLPADFPRLTNRRATSPRFTPDFAHEPHAAECIKNGRTATSADKRAITSQAASHSLCEAQGSQHYRDIRKSSWSSVKEQEGGKSQAFPHPHKLAVCLTIT